MASGGMKETSSARIAMFDISTNWTKRRWFGMNAVIKI